MTPAAPPPGLYRGIPDAEYRSWPYPSQSGLRVLRRGTPADYAYRQSHPTKPTAPMLLGSLIDAMLLEPETIPERYRWSEPGAKAWPAARCPNPECNAEPLKPCKNKDGSISKVCHPHRGDQPAEGPQRLVGADERKQADDTATAVLRHASAGRLVRGAEKQVSFVWQEPTTGVIVKGRVDLLYLLGLIIGDLKSCGAGLAADEKWAKHCWDLAYHLQAALYTDAIRDLTGVPVVWHWIPAEVEDPHHVRVIPASEAWIELGRLAYRRALRIYRDCAEVGVWPGYPEEIAPPSYPPAYAREKEDET